jgi:hypothetical protein
MEEVTVTGHTIIDPGFAYAFDNALVPAVERTARWSGAPTQGQLMKINAVSRHGYTWQMALGSMGLNDMNGRIQDAVTGRSKSSTGTRSAGKSRPTTKS